MKILQSEEQKRAFEALELKEREFISLTFEPPYKELIQADKRAFLVRLYNQAHKDTLGTPPTESIFINQCESIDRELTGVYATLTCSEIERAFNLGIRNEFGPYFGLNARTYNQFLKAYISSEDRGRAKIKYNNLLQAEYKAKSETKKSAEYYGQQCEIAYKEFLEDDSMPLVPFAIYDETVKYLGLKSLIDTDKWKDIKARGEKLYEFKQKNRGRSLADIFKENFNPEGCIKEVALKEFYLKMKEAGKLKLKE